MASEPVAAKPVTPKPVTFEAIEAAGWVRGAYVRGQDFESWAFSCAGLPGATLVHAERRGVVTQTLHMGRKVISLWPARSGALPELLTALRAGVQA